MPKLANFALFQVVWFACVLGAARGNGWIGPVAVAAAVVVHLMSVERRLEEVRLLLLVTGIGAVVDSAVAAAGAMTYAAPVATLAPLEPPWVLALWIAFGMLLRHSLSWMRGRLGLAFAFGALGGPLSMRAGVGLGALTLGADSAWSYGLLALEWALLTPLFVWLAGRPGPEQALAHGPSRN